MQSQSPPIEDTPTPSQLIYIFIGQIKDRAFYAMIAVLEKKIASRYEWVILSISH